MDVYNRLPKVAGDKYLFLPLVVDKALHFLFAFPIKSKEGVGIGNRLSDLYLPHKTPLLIRSGRGSFFTVEIVKYLYRCLDMETDCGPAKHPHGQGAAAAAVEREREQGHGSTVYFVNSVRNGRYIKTNL